MKKTDELIDDYLNLKLVGTTWHGGPTDDLTDEQKKIKKSESQRNVYINFLQKNTEASQKILNVCIGLIIITFIAFIALLAIYYKDKTIVIGFFSGQSVIIGVLIKWLVSIQNQISNDRMLELSAMLVQSESDYREFLKIVKEKMKTKAQIDFGGLLGKSKKS